MKNISIIFLFSFTFLSHFTWAQPTFYVSPEFQLVDQGDQVCYKIRTRDFSFILSTSFTLTWDPGVLSDAFITPGSLNSELTQLDLGDFEINDDEGYMIFDWSNGQPCNVNNPNLNVTLNPDEQSLFEICFQATGIYGNHTPLKITDEPKDIVVKRYNSNCQNIMPQAGFTFDGFLSIGTDPMRVNISSADGFQGETVCLDFTVEDFDNLVSNQYFIFWNPNILLFENAIASGLPGFGPGNLGLDSVDEGLAAVSWNAVGSPITVPDGTQILQFCFKILGTCGQRSLVYIDDAEDQLIEIIDGVTVGTNGTNIGLLDNAGEVSVKCFNPNGINLSIEDKNVCPGETFTVDITVGNFMDVVKLQFGLKWNPSIIQLLNTSNDGISFPPNDTNEPCFQFDSPSTLKTFPSQGRIEVDWSGGNFGCDMFDGERLMRLHFRAVGPGATNTTIAVINPILVDLFGGQVVNVGINNDNGLVSICQLDSPTLVASSGSFNPGENVCVNITSQDFTDITLTHYNISWEPSVLSYTGVQNFNLPGMGPFNFLEIQAQVQGNLGVAWEPASPVSVPNGTSLFQVCFDVIGDPDTCSVIQFTDNFIPLNIETSESNGTNVGLNGQQGEVCVLNPFDFSMTVSEIYGTPGQKVVVDVSVENFLQLKRLQHSFSWKSDIIQYDSLVSTGAIPNFNSTHFNDSSPAIDNGQMYVNWSTSNINGLTVPDGTVIYQLHFTIIGNPGQCSGVRVDDWTAPFVVNSAITGSANLRLEADNGFVCVNQSFLSLVSADITDVDCSSSPNGSINLTMTGGSGNYSYNWSGPGTIQGMEDQTGLAPGNYAVTVTDIDNPSLKVQSTFQVLLSPTAPVADAGVDTSFSCSGGVATLTLNGSGSTQTGVTYFWRNAPPPGGFQGIIVGGQGTLSPVVIGGSCYELTVTQASTGCIVKDTVCISAPVNPNPMIVDTLPTVITCAADTLTLSGGQPQTIFQYEWYAGPGGNIVAGTETSLQPKVTEPGWYYYRMYHTTTSCEETDSILIQEGRVYPVANAGSTDTLGCDENSVMLNGSNSTLDNAVYQWLPVTNGEICGADNLINVVACAGGTYQLIVTDTLNGCSAMDEVIVAADTLRPVANAGSNAVLTCSVDEITLDGTASSQGDDFQYVWLDSNNAIVGNDITLAITTPGLYTLEVENTSNGCKATSEVEVEDNSQEPVATASLNNHITCLLDTATLDGSGSSTGPAFTYEWISPGMASIGSGLTINVGEPGIYNFVVTNTSNDCVSEFPIEVLPQNQPIPVQAGVDTTIGCFGGVTLAGTFTNFNQDVLVQWSGPGMLGCINQSSTPTPTVTCPGTYLMTVQDTLTGCIGVDTLEVVPDTQPPVVSAGNDDVFPCSLTEFELNGTSDIQDITVAWSSPAGDPITNGTTLNPTIQVAGTYVLTVTSNLNNCSSTDFVVITEPTPPSASIEGDTITDCASPNVTLTASASAPTVSYEWEAVSGTISPDQVNQSVVVVPAGVYQVIVTDALGCTGTAVHTIVPNEDQPTADAGENAEIPCDGSAITLDGSGSDPGMNYLWTNAQGALVGSGVSVQVNTAGVYTLTVTNPDNQCQSVSSVTISQATSGSTPATAEFDHAPCAVEAILIGNLPAGTTGLWTSSTGAVIEDPSSETTMVNGLGEGDNIFNWTLSLGSCINYSTAQVVVSIDQSIPQPIDDEIALLPGTGGSIAVNVLENDNFNPVQTTFNVIADDVPGELTFNADGTVTFTKVKCFIGTLDIEYELCNTDCPDLCNTAILSIEVLPDDADRCGEAPNGITPNGDGVNDELVFDELLNTTAEYPNNEIIIFNRWGDIVYQAKPYLNDWNGKNNSGNDLPAGTYYYILRLDIASGDIIRGDVTILK